MHLQGKGTLFVTACAIITQTQKQKRSITPQMTALKNTGTAAASYRSSCC